MVEPSLATLFSRSEELLIALLVESASMVVPLVGVVWLGPGWSVEYITTSLRS